MIIAALALLSSDPLASAIATAQSGAQLQALRLKIASENIASSSVLSTSQGIPPYRRRVVKAKAACCRGRFSLAYGTTRDFKRPFVFKYDPDHPAANKEGYVSSPNVDKSIEMADIAEAKVGYDLNVRLIKLFTDMSRATFGIIK